MKKLLESVVIVDASGAISNGGVDVLIRHAEYGHALSVVSGGKLTLVILGSEKLKKLADENAITDVIVLAIRTRGLIGFLETKKISRLLGDNLISPRLFVLGDPWKSALVGMLYKWTTFSKTPFQLQLHADLASPRWKSQNLRNFLKYLIASFSIICFNNLRVVSKSQAKNLKLSTCKRVDVIPVSLSGGNQKSSARSKREGLVFGFFGRLHPDRGTDRLIKIFNECLSKNDDVKLLIGGDGPDMDRLTQHLQKQFPNKVTLLGHVSKEATEGFWRDIDILISLAPFESYGRSLRESVLNGCPVIAMPSSGVFDLLEVAGNSWVSLIEPGDNSEVVLQKARALAGLTNRDDLPESLIHPESSSELLAASWAEIIG